MTLAYGKVLLHLSGRQRRVVDADDIYYLEAQGDETDVRLRAARRLRDVRSLGEVVNRRSGHRWLASRAVARDSRSAVARADPLVCEELLDGAVSGQARI